MESQLTEEQRERIRINRDRALAIRKQRIQEQQERERPQPQQSADCGNEKNSTTDNNDKDNSTTAATTETVVSTSQSDDDIRKIGSNSPCAVTENLNPSTTVATKPLSQGGDNTTTTNNYDSDTSMEDFERTASKYVTKTEAMKVYCLPTGTIDVCKCIIEKDNPINKKFTASKMKLYLRSEIRRRAYKRYGGKHGLQVERHKRQQRQYENTIKRTRDVFR